MQEGEMMFVKQLLSHTPLVLLLSVDVIHAAISIEQDINSTFPPKGWRNQVQLAALQAIGSSPKSITDSPTPTPTSVADSRSSTPVATSCHSDDGKNSSCESSSPLTGKEDHGRTTVPTSDSTYPFINQTNLNHTHSYNTTSAPKGNQWLRYGIPFLTSTFMVLSLALLFIYLYYQERKRFRPNRKLSGKPKEMFNLAAT